MSEGIGTKDTELDVEWLELIKEAKEIGLTFEEIRNFFVIKECRLEIG